VKWDNMQVGDLVKDCSFYRDGRDDDHVGVIVATSEFSIMLRRISIITPSEF